ncbi:uncharacterized protein Tco025E_00762 [Trypanosoma conorhini]|uniref:Uncharacterized protein n=1 Tax=Trypanosoma conorhini TaxID=83891 RepID=A0A422QAJ8_9TRYP|nr:uncharacterized protein Tco025E_00762 [Trypanosoma conorhini]RNF27006.1 hypothetical protein Tco025E_00762 [Trypanosoma conorhini]
MSQAVRIRTEKPPVLRGPKRRYAKTTPTTPFPGFIPGASFDAAAPSRREALQQFHRLEMMVEVEERLRAENGLVLSDTGGVSDDDYPVCENTTAEKSGEGSAAAAALHDAREEIAGRTLHADPYCKENVWSEARRECQLEGGHSSGEAADMHFATRGNFIEEDGALEGDTHAAIMADLGRLHSRLQQARSRHARHLTPRQRGQPSPLGDGAAAASVTSDDSVVSSEEAEFDPERYVAPLLRCTHLVEGADLRTPDFGGEDGGVARFRAVRDALPGATSVQEALRLLQYSVHSNRPEVAACVRRCQEQRRQHQPTAAVANLLTEEAAEPEPPKAARKATRGREEDAAAASRSDPPPSAAAVAAMVARTLPRIPDELRDELVDQRRLLERLAAAQEASLRQLSREQQEAARRRIMAPRADPTLALLAPPKLRRAEPFEIAEALQKIQDDPKRPLPPVITISTMRPQTPLVLPPTPPSLPPHYIEEELGRLHCQYERLLRDERRAWTNIMQEQRKAFEQEKNATIQTLRYAAVRQQHENTEEIKRAIAAQELKRRRWQHAAELKQRSAFQQMLYKALPPGEDGLGRVVGGRRAVAATAMPARRQRQQQLADVSEDEEDAANKFENEEGENSNDNNTTNKKRDLRHPIVTGPFSVVLPEEPCGEAAAPAHNASSQRAEEVVLLSDKEERGAGHHQTRGDAKVGLHASTVKRRIGVPSPAGNREKFPRPQRSPYAAPPRRPLRAGAAPGSKSTAALHHTRASPRSRNARSQHQSFSRRSAEGSPYAFAVHDAPPNTEQRFYNTAETVLTDSIHSLNATLPPSSVASAVGGCPHPFENIPSRGEASAGQAVFPGSILLLSNPLTAEEAERRRGVARAFDVSLPPPPQVTTAEGGKEMQRPCDVYYFGEEAAALTPRRRARLRAAEARTRIEARRRLERIKALSLTSPGQKLGESRPSFTEKFLAAEESEQRLTDLIASETIHSIIGDAAEASLFAALINELEDELVSAELHHLTSKNLEGNDEAARRPQANEKEEDGKGDVNAPDTVPVERVAATLHTFAAPINEEYSLQGTVLRLLEESLLQLCLRQTSAEEPKEEKTQEEAGERGAGEVVPEREQTALASDALPETEREPLWVREVVSATTDPLWRAPEGEASPPCASSVPAATLTTTSGKDRLSLPPPPSINATATQLPLLAAPQKDVVLTLEGANGSVVPDVTGTLRIVLDIAPVMEQLAAVALPAAVQPASPAHGGALASEARQMPCVMEDEILSCEVVEPAVTRTTHDLPATKELKSEELQEVKPPPLVSSTPQGELPLPEGVVAVTKVPNARQSLYIELEQQRERARLSDNELLQRQMLEEQEEALRSSWHMMWDWQQMNFAILNQHRDQHNLCVSASQSVAVAAPHREAEAVANDDETRGKEVLPPVPSTSTIRDPITRFIFEWMHDYDKKEEEKPVRRSFVEMLHEASHMARESALQEGSDGTSMAEMDLRRRLLMELDNADSSSWLSSTHASSIASDGFPRFTTRPQHNVARPRRTYRRRDENPSSATTETTRYTSSSSTPWTAQEPWGGGVSPPQKAVVRNPTSTTVTTTSSSGRTWFSTSSSERPHLSDTMLRRLRQIRSSDPSPQEEEEEEGQSREYNSVEELRREVERIQAAQQKAAQ